MVLSLALVVIILLALPSDYFLPQGPTRRWLSRHPAVVITVHVLKNAAGVGLVVLGVLLSVPGIPGQGLLTILAGLILLDFPGKRKLELRIIRIAWVHRAANRLRRLFGRAPLELPTPNGSSKVEPWNTA